MRVIGSHTIIMPARPFLPVNAAGELSPIADTDIRNTLGMFITTGKIPR